MLQGGSLRAAGGRVLGALCLVGVGLLAQASGCAQPTDGTGGRSGEEDTGSGGAGGAGAGPVVTTSSGGGSGETTSTTSTTSGGSGCGAQEHMCGGICVGNTPQTGCFTSTSCSPCQAPANGTVLCTADGLCDTQCNPGYEEQGAACVCPSQCCSNADCGGGGMACNGGVCQCVAQCCSDNDCPYNYEVCDGGACACDPALCIIDCGGFGACIGNDCFCG